MLSCTLCLSPKRTVEREEAFARSTTTFTGRAAVLSWMCPALLLVSGLGKGSAVFELELELERVGTVIGLLLDRFSMPLNTAFRCIIGT